MRGTREYVQFLRVALARRRNWTRNCPWPRTWGISRRNIRELQGELEEIIKLLRSYIAKMTDTKVREDEPYSLDTNPNHYRYLYPLPPIRYPYPLPLPLFQDGDKDEISRDTPAR